MVLRRDLQGKHYFMVDNTHSENMYLVYGANWCPFCRDAVSFLQDKGYENRFFDASSDEVFLEQIKSFYTSSTIPVILSIDKKTGLCSLIGGFSDLKKVFLEN